MRIKCKKYDDFLVFFTTEWDNNYWYSKTINIEKMET